MDNGLGMKYFYLLFFILIAGCQNPPSQSAVTMFSDNVMTIDYRILIGETLSNEQKAKVQEIINRTFSKVNQVYNKWNEHSEISTLNKLKAGERFALSYELEQFLLQTQKIVEISNGRFDPTIEPLQQLWKSHLSVGKIPSDEEINAIIPAIGWDKIHFENGSFYKDHDLTRIDLGGIAKGYCVDLLVESFNAAGFSNVFVEWGGEIRTSGQHPDNRPWNIFISRLGDSNPEHAIDTLSLKDQAIATSGDYLQNWDVKPTTYFHIFDPKTYRPLEITQHSVASASVLAPTCMLADGLATVAMMFPNIEEAQAWAERVKEQLPETQFWLVSRSDENRAEF